MKKHYKNAKVPLLICVLALFLTGSVAPDVSHAEYPIPGKTIIFIVPVAVGGGYDAYTRLLVPYLSKELGAKIVIRNTPGAEWKIGYHKIYTAKPDGHTIGIWNPGPLANDKDILGKVDYDMTTFTFLYRICNEPRVVVTKAGGDIKDFKDLLEKGRSPDFKMRAASDGGVSLLEIKLMESEWGIKSEVIPYTGGSPTRMAVMRGDAHFTTASLSSAIDSLSTGRVTFPILLHEEALTEVSEAEKFISEYPQLKNVPIPADLGLKNLSFVGYAARAIIAPPGLPKDVKETLENALERVVRNETLRKEALKKDRPLGKGLRGDAYRDLMKRDKEVLIKIKHLIQ